MSPWGIERYGQTWELEYLNKKWDLFSIEILEIFFVNK